MSYTSEVQAIAAQVGVDLDYRWTLNSLISVERISAEFESSDDDGERSDLIPKAAMGATIAF